MKQIAFDISGAYGKNKSGVQNVVQSYITGYLLTKKMYKNKLDILYYDRSGNFNPDLRRRLGNQYKSINFIKDNKFSLFFKLISKFFPFNLSLKDRINHVWHWDIHTGNALINSITIHDLLPIEFPHLFTKKEIDLKKKALDFALKKANLIIFISNTTKASFLKHIGKPKGKTRVIYNGINPIFYKDLSFEEKNKVIKKYDLENKRFLISYGYVDPRKNLLRQLEAFCQFMKDNPHKNYYYLLTGFKNKKSEIILNKLRDFEFKKNIKFIGYVPDNDLTCLISKAEAVLFCSLAEGFGMPIIEAMAQKTPIITSNSGSMLELAGKNKALLVDPYSVNEIKSAISKVFDGSYLKLIDINQSYKYSKKFTINKMFNNYIKFFHE